jgi:hypothetical protein
MPELHLSVSLRLIFFFLAAACSVAFSLYVYRFTIPPVSSPLRYGLVALRSSGLFVLFLLLGEPILSLIVRSVNPPVVAVLVDNSRSMAIRDRSGQREEMLRSILRSADWQRLGEKGRVVYLLFDERIRAVASNPADSLTLNGEMTDIAGAMKDAKRMEESANLQAVVLLSDGNSTIGANPLYEAEALGVPVFALGIGDTNEQKDILVRKVLTNEIAYIGTKVPVNVTVHSTGYAGAQIRVSLSDGNETIDEKSLILLGGTRDYVVPLTLMPKKEGIGKFVVSVSRLPDELTAQNNRMSFFTKILRSKLRVVLLAGAPSEDAAFIRRLLADDKNMDAAICIEKKDGQFYETPLTSRTVSEADCLLLIGFPTARSSSQALRLISNVLEAGKPLLLVLSRTSDFTKLQTLEPFLPFGVRNVSGNELQVFASIPSDQSINPILRVGEREKTDEVWSQLPPIFQLQGSFRPKPESEILATARLQAIPLDNPLIVSRNIGGKKALAVLGYGLWRWQMMSDAGSIVSRVPASFLSNAIRWLTTREDMRKVRVGPSKEYFTSQEPIEFVAQIYDENYEPIDNARVEVRAERRGEASLITLDALGNGQYQGTVDRLPEGEYAYEGKAMLDGKELGSDKGTFSVGGLQAEYLETRMNRQLLEQIAEHTSGRYYSPDNFGTLTKDINSLPNFKSKELTAATEYELWNSRWMLALALSLFAVEWFVRKRIGML